MKLSELFHYWSLVARHPRHWRFINEGFGISARHARAKRFWTPHLEASQQFIAKSLDSLKPQSLTVLGSGGLLDFPRIDALPRSIGEIRLVDANPAHSEFYQKLKKAWLSRGISVSWLIQDITVVPDDLIADEVVISLNLISQLRLMNSRIEYPAATHLAQLGEIAGRAVILMGDVSWYTYTPDNAYWECESACPDISRWEIPGFYQSLHEQWLWHVAPYGIEQAECGTIHDVHARLFLRGDSKDAKEFSRI